MKLKVCLHCIAPKTKEIPEFWKSSTKLIPVSSSFIRLCK